MALKAQIEAIIYAAEEPVTLEQLTAVLRDAVVAEAALAESGLEARALDAEIKSRVRASLEELAAEYAASGRGMEIRQVAGGWRMATKPEHHDLVRQFVKGLKPPMRLSLPALETLSVIAYKQPVTAPEISEIRGVDSSGVIATLLDRKLVTTAGRKQVIGRPILYKTSKEFLLRFGLKDVGELPSLEEFEKLASDGQADLFESGVSAGLHPEGASAELQPGGGSAELQPGEPEVATDGALAPAHAASEIVPEQDEAGVAQAPSTAESSADHAMPESAEAARACDPTPTQEATPSVAPGDESSQSAEPVSDFPQ